MVTENTEPAEELESAGPVDFPEGITKEWLVEKSKKLNKAFQDWFEPFLKSIDDNYKLFEGKPIEGMIPGAIPLPIPNSIIETNMSRLMGAFLSRDKLVDAIQKIPQDGLPMSAEDASARVEDLVNEAIRNNPDAAEKCDEMFKLLLLETICFAEIYKDEEEVLLMTPQRDIDPETQAPVMTGLNENTIKLSFPNFMPVSARDMAWEPREKWNIERSPWIRKRSIVSGSDLMVMAQDGVIEDPSPVFDKVPKVSATGTTDRSDPDASRVQRVEGVGLPNASFDDSNYQLDQWWATITWKKGDQYQTDEFIYWILGGEEVVKFEVNGLKPKRKPWVCGRLNRKPGMLMAQGPMDIIKPLTIDLANTMARKNKLVISTANTPTFFEPSTGLDLRRMALQENSYIPVLNSKGINRTEPPVNAISILDRHMGFLIGHSREATAANEQAQGVGSDSDTATEAKILDSSAGMRFQYASEMLFNSVFAKMARQFYLLYKQFPAEMNMTIREAGVDGKAVSVLPEDLAGDYDFKAIGSQSITNRLNKFRLLEELLMKLVQAFQMNPLMFVSKDGRQMQLTPFEFLTEQMLPLVDVKPGATLFQQAKMDPMMMADPMQNSNSMKVAPKGPVDGRETMGMPGGQ